MKLTDDHGITVALVEPDEYRAGRWFDGASEADVVRILRPPDDDWATLLADGFVLKPTTITWAAPIDPTEQEYFGRLTKSVRWRIRRARTVAFESGIRIVTEDTVTEEGFDRFLEIYTDALARMRHGYPVAVKRRDAILAGDRKYYTVYAYHGSDLVAGCICIESTEDSTVRMAFSASTDLAKRLYLVRVLYAAAISMARDKGYRAMTLGNDPNLYGHLCQPGLITFKASVGFNPCPSQLCGDTGGYDEADLVLTLRELSDPTIVLGYPGATAGGPLHAYAITMDPGAADLSPYTVVRSLGGVSVRAVGGPPWQAGR